MSAFCSLNNGIDVNRLKMSQRLSTRQGKDSMILGQTTSYAYRGLRFYDCDFACRISAASLRLLRMEISSLLGLRNCPISAFCMRPPGYRQK